jgi:RimJ/RimL family protein N-acetyltransferase
MRRQGKVILETPRLVLRELAPEDADDIARIICDPVAMKHFPTSFTRADADRWVARNMRRYAADGHGLWAVIVRETGELAGDCGVTTQNVDGIDEREIGYHFRRDHRGRGYATEAARACREWAFANTPAEYVISLIRPENASSQRVAERNGMTMWKTVIWRELNHCVYRINRGSVAAGSDTGSPCGGTGDLARPESRPKRKAGIPPALTSDQHSLYQVLQFQPRISAFPRRTEFSIHIMGIVVALLLLQAFAQPE